MKLLRIIALALIGLLLLSLQCLGKSVEEGYSSFSVTFEQDGKVVKPNGHVINLQKKEFAIVVTFDGYHGEPVAVRLHTSINDNYYKVASNGFQVADLLSDGIGMAEPVNVQKNLILTDMKAVQYLFINANNSRFQDVKVEGKAISGKRYVTELCFRGGKDFPVQNLATNELYMVFIKRNKTGVQQEYYLVQFPKPGLSNQPLTAEQWIQKGMKYGQLKDLGLEIEAYNKALAINPQHYEAYLRRGAAYASADKIDLAIIDCNTAIGINQKNTMAYTLRGAIYAATGKREQAIEDYSTVVSLDPKNVFAYLQRGVLYYNEKNTYRSSIEDKAKALSDFTQIIELQPNNISAYELRAGVYSSLRDYVKALDDYSHAILLAPDIIRLYEKRAMCYRFMGDWGKEFDDRNKLVELDPKNPNAYGNRALVGKEIGKDMNQVIKDFTKEIELSQGRPGKREGLATVYHYRGEAFRANGQTGEAITDFTTAISLKPDYIILYHSRGAAYFEKGDYDMAIVDCTRAIELGHSINPWTYLVRGKAYKAKGEYQEAICDFDTALKAKPDLEEAKVERNSLK